MVFGEIAALLHYNGSSRTVAEIANHSLGIPALSFFEDFGSLTPIFLTPTSASDIYAFCATLWVKLEDAKSEY